MIGIDSKCLHNMVPYLGTGIDTSRPNKAATARLTARRMPERRLHVTENWIQDWPEILKFYHFYLKAKSGNLNLFLRILPFFP